MYILFQKYIQAIINTYIQQASNMQSVPRMLCFIRFYIT